MPAPRPNRKIPEPEKPLPINGRAKVGQAQNVTGYQSVFARVNSRIVRSISGGFRQHFQHLPKDSFRKRPLYIEVRVGREAELGSVNLKTEMLEDCCRRGFSDRDHERFF